MKPSAFDGLRPLIDAGCDMYFESGLARRARHRQAIEQEREILVGDVEQLSGVGGVCGNIHSNFRRRVGRAIGRTSCGSKSAKD